MFVADASSRAYLTDPKTPTEREVEGDVTIHTVLHNTHLTPVSLHMLDDFRETTSHDPELSKLHQALLCIDAEVNDRLVKQLKG